MATPSSLRAKCASVVMLLAMAILPLCSLAGMTPVEVETFEGYRLKAEKGEATYEYLLAGCYSDGFGTDKDDVKAATWYLRAAHQGLDVAQAAIASRYLDGKGVIRDTIEAYAYYNLAAVDSVVYRISLNALEKSMTPEAILRGQQRTRELKKEIEAKIAAKKAGK